MELETIKQANKNLIISELNKYELHYKSERELNFYVDNLGLKKIDYVGLGDEYQVNETRFIKIFLYIQYGIGILTFKTSFDLSIKDNRKELDF